MGDNGRGLKQKLERLGEENISIQGYLIRIIEYNSATNIIVEFQDKYKTKIKTAYKEFKNGNIRNPHHPTIAEKGYLGIGKYSSRENGKQTTIYIVWRHMIERCYDSRMWDKYPTYKDCYVCDEWLNFQNFAKWYEKNIYECNGEKMHIDKDILCKGNKIYSPNTCIFVPERINELFTKRQNCRGDYPIGVAYCDRDKALISRCSVNHKSKHLGYFPLNRPFQAFYTYKVFKENHIKQIANEYKNLIPTKLYDALYKYEVEIND